ncbi:MAG: hypothetical protein ACIARR_07840 [Phycisphaerales bacterium JB059]
MTTQDTPPTVHNDTDGFDLADPPKWPKVVGAISIVWALLGLTCGGIGLASPAFVAPLMESQLDGDPLPPTMVLTTTDYALAAFGLLLAVLLMIGGVTLLMRKPIARPLHILYGLGAIPSLVVSTLLNFSKQEAALQWAKDYPDNPMAQQMNAGGPGQAIGVIITLVIILFFMTYPLFCVIWFALVKNKREHLTGGVEEVF